MTRMKMNVGRWLLFGLFWLLASGRGFALNTNVRISHLLRFETNAVGDLVSRSDQDTNIWNKFTETAAPGLWQLGGSTVGSMSLDTSIGSQLWGVHLAGSGQLIRWQPDTRSLKFDDRASNHEFMGYIFSGGAKAKASWGYYIRWTGFSTDFSSYDFVFADSANGDFAGLQFYNNANLDTALETANHAAPGTSASVALQRNKTYWITTKWDQTVNLVTMAIYDPVNWSVLLSVNRPINDAGVNGGVTCRRLTVGRYDAHANSASVGSFHWIDNLVIDDTGANYPMFPGSVWMADSVNRTDVLAAYNAAAAGGETIVIPSGNGTWGSGIVFSKALLRVTSVAGSNSTIITGTWAGTGSTIGNEHVINAAGIEIDGIRFIMPVESGASGIHNRLFTVDFGGDYFRFHDCQFINGMIYVVDPFGCAYRSAFAGADYCLRIQGSLASGQHYTCCFPWNSTSTNLVDVEDCEFAAYPGAATNPLILSTQQGGIWCVRHNHGRFSGTAGSPDMGNMIDFHGPTSGTRGSIGGILASNYFEFAGAGIGEIYDQRGGTMLIYSNIVTGIAATGRLRVAGNSGNAQDEPQYFQNGGVEQITNTYIFTNIFNGIIPDPVIGDGFLNINDALVITLGKSYFLQPPQTLLVPPYPFPGRHDALAQTGNPPPPTAGSSGRTPGHLGKATAIGGPP